MSPHNHHQRPNKIRIAVRRQMYDMPPGTFQFQTDAIRYIHMNCPGCGATIGLSKHTITEDAHDSAITVHPSIHHKECGTHFWIRKNKIYYV